MRINFIFREKNDTPILIFYFIRYETEKQNKNQQKQQKKAEIVSF